MKKIIKTHVIGYTFNGINYTYGCAHTHSGIRIGMEEYPHYCLLNPTTEEELIIQRSKSDMPSKAIYIGDYLRYVNDMAVDRLIKSGWDLVLSIGDMPSATPLTEEYEVVVMDTADGYTFQLMAGDKLQLTECGSVVESFNIPIATTLTLNGDNLDKVIDSIIRRASDPTYNTVESLFDYSVVAPFGITTDIRTGTDIGGHYLEVVRGENRAQIVHLHNGFGDGSYTLRFRENLLIR